MIFEFISEGPKGRIVKMVSYTSMHIPGVYNLGFGDKNIITGAIDDNIITDNGDSKKVLATVAYTLYDFTNAYPKLMIHAKGNTEARTRLYRMGIANNFELIKDDFDIYGKLNGRNFRFERNKNYDAFFAKRKKW